LRIRGFPSGRVKQYTYCGVFPGRERSGLRHGFVHFRR
jgi:hypothetical protein